MKKSSLGKPEEKGGKLNRYKNKEIAWVELGGFIIGEGSRKAIKALQEIEGETYLKHFAVLAEYFKSRLTRNDSQAGSKIVINVNTQDAITDKPRDVIEGNVVIKEELPSN